MATPEQELERQAQAARARDQRDQERIEQAHRKAVARAAAKLERSRSRARNAPGFFGSMTFVWFLATALLALALAFVLAFQGQLEQYGLWFGPPAIVWAIAFLIFWMDAVTWRSRLPFRLTGDRVIHGRDNTDSDEVPWIEVQVTVELTGSGAQTAVEHALQLLATRANRLLRGDKEANFGGDRIWRVEGNIVRGETDPSFWTTRVLEKWARRDLRLLRKITPIHQIKVHARYTGRSYRANFD